MFVIQRVLEVAGKLTLLDNNRVINPHQKQWQLGFEVPKVKRLL